MLVYKKNKKFQVTFKYSHFHQYKHLAYKQGSCIFMPKIYLAIATNRFSNHLKGSAMATGVPSRKVSFLFILFSSPSSFKYSSLKYSTILHIWTETAMFCVNVLVAKI